MSKPLDELYFNWLCGQVGESVERKSSRSFLNILRKLFTTEFIYLIPNDDNRARDGRNLRYEFVDDLELEVPEDWMDQGCSILELIIGLSRRLSFELEGEPHLWFWRLVENLDLEQYNDSTPFPEKHVDHILSNLIWRTYKPNGRGGLFPLKARGGPDQRDVELFYQMQAYVLERA